MTEGTTAVALEAMQVTVPGLLLVDDRDENLLALEAILQDDLAVPVHRARSGEEALELLLRHEFALALVDVQMPRMDGIELAELMRGPERTRHVPIIFVTAAEHDEARVLRAYRSGGAIDFLHKPLSPQVVRGKVRVLLELDRRRREARAQLQRTTEALAEANAARQALAEANLLRERLLAIVSHDLRTPLSAISLSLELLARGQLGADRSASLVDRARRSAASMQAMIQELLEFSRAQQPGGFPLSPGRCCLDEACRGVVAEVRAANAGTEVAFASSGPLEGWWDGRALAQALTNLVDNGVRHGAGATVSVAVRREDDDAVVEVHNGGDPIPAELVPHLFDPYRKGRPGPSPRGLGLGLFIVREIVQAHGGSIGVVSTRRTGTRFTVRLPVSRPPGER